MSKQTMELNAIRKQLVESPPPAPSGTSIREWFAGLAMMNPVLMAGVPAVERAAEAVRLADQLIAALAAPRMPSPESLKPPPREDMANWERQLSEANSQKERQARVTCPAIRKAKVPLPSEMSVPPAPVSRNPTMRFGAILPPPIGAPLPPEPEVPVTLGPNSPTLPSLQAPFAFYRDRRAALPVSSQYSTILR